ncbi:MAG: hypothetical protein JWM27_3352 [Gemmatimonadetes bacterium]|nr:hypothetical protein [Gemmatimonadota bacterium]
MLLAALSVFLLPATLAAQQPPDSTAKADSLRRAREEMAAMPGMEHDSLPSAAGPSGPMTRAASGTAWQPDASPMAGVHRQVHGWGVMAHGAATLVDDRQGGARGGTSTVLLNWMMLSGARPAGRGELSLRAMASAEPFTVPGAGYRELLQTGEVYRGQSVHDRQHPHDLFMELSAAYTAPVTRRLGASLYLAPVGEPAAGPPTYMHRASAQGNPFAPLGHHWQDATHVSFGVATAGLFTRRARLEGSVFNGREPDQVRTNFDYRGRSLDSYAGRLTVNPGAHWSLGASYAYLRSPEPVLIRADTTAPASASAIPGGDGPAVVPAGIRASRSVEAQAPAAPHGHLTFTPSFAGQAPPSTALHRATLSAMTAGRLGRGTTWAATLVGSVQKHAYQTARSPSVLLEASAGGRRNTLFGRAEWVRKSDGDLVVEGAVTRPPVRYPPGAIPPPPRTVYYDVGALSLGCVRTLAARAGGELALGVEGSASRVPAALRPDYGSRTPLSAAVFLRARLAGR